LSGGTLDFDGTEGVLLGNVNMSITSNIAGSAGLTVADSGSTTLTPTNAGNSYTGGTTLNQGTLVLGNISALGNSALTLTGGTLSNGVGNNFALANPVNFTNSVVTLGGTNRTFLTGPITLTGNVQITVVVPTFFSGVVTDGATQGTLNLLAGNALVMQNPNNTYSGGTNVGGQGANAQLQVNSSDVFVSGNIVSGPLGNGPSHLTPTSAP